jgi:hypothetical protein
MRTRSLKRRGFVFSVMLFASMLLSIVTTGNPFGLEIANAAISPAYTCTGSLFFGTSSEGTVFNVGDTWQGGTFTFIENDHFMRVREDDGALVGRFPMGFLNGDMATIEFDRVIRIVAILWYDNDPNPGEAGWSFNGIAGPLTGDGNGTWTFHNLVTNIVNIDAGGDSGGIDFCFEEIGAQGCTPGYWKNHLDAWAATGYSPGQTVSSVFSGADPSLAGATLLQALNFKGGSKIVGAQQILLRAAVASLLNAAHAGVGFPLTTADVIASVNAALASGDRDAILALAADLDAKNNLGCPLN